MKNILNTPPSSPTSNHTVEKVLITVKWYLLVTLGGVALQESLHYGCSTEINFLNQQQSIFGLENIITVIENLKWSISLNLDFERRIFKDF